MPSANVPVNDENHRKIVKKQALTFREKLCLSGRNFLRLEYN